MYPLYTFAGNETLTRPTKAGGTWSFSQNQESNLEIVAITMRYSITKSVSDTMIITTKTYPATKDNVQAITQGMSASVTVSGGTVISTETGKGWVDGNTSSPQQTGQSSSKYFSDYTPTNGWSFKSWIVGPPPTDESPGQPQTIVTQMSEEKIDFEAHS